MDVVNRPRVSGFVAGLYVGVVVFVAALIVFFTYASFFTPMGILGLTAVAVLIFVEGIMLLILISIYRTKYILTNKELIELAEYLQAPVTTSMSGRSSIPEDHPLCLIPASPGTGALVAQVEADVVLLVGGRLGDVEMWGQPPMAWGDPSQQKFIQIDISSDMIGLNRQVEIGIVGDAKSTLRVLLETIKKYTPRKRERESLQSYKQVEKQLQGYDLEILESSAILMDYPRTCVWVLWWKVCIDWCQVITSEIMLICPIDCSVACCYAAPPLCPVCITICGYGCFIAMYYGADAFYNWCVSTFNCPAHWLT